MRAALADEAGSMTAFGLFIFTACLMLSGYAIDVGNAVRARTKLQIVADATAHAALLTRESATEETAKQTALDMARRMLPVERHGNVLDAEDIEFGVWDAEQRIFTPEPGSRRAARVVANQNELRDNPVETYMLKLVGLDAWDLAGEAIVVTYKPTCFREGFVSEDVVDIQSNNTFTNGFCIHSNEYVSLNNNNYFEPGTVVSMPNPDEIELPASGFDKNEGLSEALRSGSYNVRILKQIDDIIAGLHAFDPRYVPDYITSDVPLVLQPGKLSAADFKPGRLHRISCAGRRLSISDGLLYDMVLVTDCEVNFVNVALENAVVATSHVGTTPMHHNSAMRIGRDDACAEGGGAQLVSLGGMSFAGNLEIYGSQLLAAGEIKFAANADGIQGASLVAGGMIDGTSNMSMGFCGTGMDANYQADYFKLVQ